MGDRGAFSTDYGKTGGISIEFRKYSEVWRIGKVKVIQSDETSNNHTPTYSNTSNTTYFAYSKERDKIEAGIIVLLKVLISVKTKRHLMCITGVLPVWSVENGMTNAIYLNCQKETRD